MLLIPRTAPTGLLQQDMNELNEEDVFPEGRPSAPGSLAVANDLESISDLTLFFRPNLPVDQRQLEQQLLQVGIELIARKRGLRGPQSIECGLEFGPPFEQAGQLGVRVGRDEHVGPQIGRSRERSVRPL